MSFEEKLKEFYDCDIKDKFSTKTNARFSDGTSMGQWFKRKDTKDIIYSSNEQICIEIKRAHKKYLDEIKNSSKNREVSYKYYFEMRNVKCKEFLECLDFEKFNVDSKLAFSNGMIMSKWFLENKIYILSSKNELCIEIAKQYQEYLNNIKKQRERKNRLIYEKNKHLFYREKDLNKYDNTSTLKFPDGMFMGEWFMIYKDYILSSNGCFEKAIKDKYELFLLTRSLKTEFLEEENFEKFDIYGYVRFSTGALMNAYWEVYQKEILNSKCNIDRLIAKQYEEYLREQKQDIVYLDDKVNTEIKVQKKV